MSDIQVLFDGLQPIQKFLPNGQTHFTNETLKRVCHNILTASDESIKKCQEQLAQVPRERFGKQAYILDLLPRLQGQYDRGSGKPGHVAVRLPSCTKILRLRQWY